MQVWNVLHAARWKCRTKKIAKDSPSGHHRTTLSGHIFATKARNNNWKKLVKQQCLPHMSSQYGELWPTNGWDLLARFGHPANLNGFRVLAALLHGTRVVGVRMEEGQSLHALTIYHRHDNTASWDAPLNKLLTSHLWRSEPYLLRTTLTHKHSVEMHVNTTTAPHTASI